VVQTPSPPLLHRFAPHVAELPVARHALRDWLTRAPRDPDAVQELLIVATELGTNAVRHAGAGLVTLRAWEDGEAVVIEVESVDNAAEKSTVVRNLDDPLEEGGRGMVIVQALCNDVSIVMRGRTRYVRCRKFVPHRYEAANV
jgi:anti-sigma regulatory factor (Ser/Thr protein kinase)